jgi:tRNA (adenine57-N1/adenine58-N1)-methyltransferase
LLRAGANLVGYELREDFIEVAKNNITKYSKHIFGRHIDQEELFAGTGLKKSGSEISLSIQHRDIYQGIDERGLDRIVLDLPEPWRVLPFAKDALKKGGIFLCYLPTINQTATFRSALKDNGFILAQTFEVLHRSWHIEGQSVRPDHRMVAHTGFITTARLLNTNQM